MKEELGVELQCRVLAQQEQRPCVRWDGRGVGGESVNATFRKSLHVKDALVTWALYLQVVHSHSRFD